MEDVLKFRVLVDTEEEKDVFRDIEILANQSFLTFHNAILNAFEFSNDQMASFYLSNDNWDKGEEITLMPFDFDSGDTSKSMDDTTLGSRVSKKNQKLLYVYDFLAMWCFYIELVEINHPVDKDYPVVTHIYGKAHDQYSKEIEIDTEDDKYMLGNDYDDELDDTISFENIDDLDI